MGLDLILFMSDDLQRLQKLFAGDSAVPGKGEFLVWQPHAGT